MATAGDDGNSVNCPICLENYVEPRQLPTCAHCFCEGCIIKYVSKLIQAEDGDLEKGIPCPFCRVGNTAPKNQDGLKEWVKSLKRNEASLTKRSGDEKECSKNWECDSCRKFGISTRASKVCFTCFELFCVPCRVGRHSLKGFEKHKFGDLEEVFCGATSSEEDLKEFRLLREYSYCSIHSEMEMKFYCKDDDTVCCGTCAVVSHRHCGNVTELNIETSRNETKEEIQSLNASIDKLVSFAKNTIAAMKKCVMDSKAETENIKETLHNLRRKINSLLDTLEESVGEQSKAIAKKAALLEENDEEALNTVISSLGVCSSILEKVIKYGSASQIHAVLTKVKDTVEQHEMTVLDKIDVFEAVSPELKLENTLQIFLTLGPNDTDKLASVNEKSQEPCRPCCHGVTSLRNCSVVKNTVKSLKEPKAERGWATLYTDIVFLHNGNLVLNDNFNGYVYLANKEHEITAFCDIKTQAKEYSLAPYSCSSFRDGMIAVSAPEQRKIYTLSASGTLTINGNISTKYKPVAIHCLKTGDIAVSWKEPVAFGIISNDREAREKTYFCKDKSGRELKSFDYMAVDEDRKHVIQPCKEGKAVFCFDYEGFPKFKYTNSGLTYPRGVALDKQGNVYVCNSGRGAYAVHVVTPSGKAVRIVKEGCSQCPLAIAFMKNGREFAITQFDDFRLVTFFSLQNP